ncbi:MAG: DUF72 domain-containing protein, partial [Planctomycetes bacterium]|nr:DUF72 domain-containing protein [Planctomycetota bacterium]
GYLRLHGRSRAGWSRPDASRDERYDHYYDSGEVEEIIAAIGVLSARVPRILVAANNHFRAQAPAAVVALRYRWEGQPVDAPRRLAEAYPALRGAIVDREPRELCFEEGATGP